eukprot:1280327-Rhodomonas_salina.4
MRADTRELSLNLNLKTPFPGHCSPASTPTSLASCFANGCTGPSPRCPELEASASTGTVSPNGAPIPSAPAPDSALSLPPARTGACAAG